MSNKYQFRGFDGLKTNFQDWSEVNNRYNSVSYTPKRPPAKRLIENVIREFEVFCRHYHIDASKYRYIEAFEMEGSWCQFDFVDEKGCKISVHSIIYVKNYKIMQRVIDI